MVMSAKVSVHVNKGTEQIFKAHLQCCPSDRLYLQIANVTPTY